MQCFILSGILSSSTPPFHHAKDASDGEKEGRKEGGASFHVSSIGETVCLLEAAWRMTATMATTTTIQPRNLVAITFILMGTSIARTKRLASLILVSLFVSPTTLSRVLLLTFCARHRPEVCHPHLLTLVILFLIHTANIYYSFLSLFFHSLLFD